MTENPVFIQKETHLQQVGFMVRDVEKVIGFLTLLGFGPFHLKDVVHPSAWVRGEISSYKVRIATTQLGEVQLEIVQPIDGVTIQQEFLDECGEGLHHLLFQVSDLQWALQRLTELGVNTIQKDQFIGGGGMAYVESIHLSGLILELVQYPPGYQSGDALNYLAD